MPYMIYTRLVASVAGRNYSLRQGSPEFSCAFLNFPGASQAKSVDVEGVWNRALNIQNKSQKAQTRHIVSL